MNAESILAMLDCQIADREDRARRYIRKAGKERKRRGAPQTTAERMSEYHCHRLDELKQIRAWVAARAALEVVARTETNHEWIERTNREYAAWCRTEYVPEALDERGFKSLHGLWAWQAQDRRLSSAATITQAPADYGKTYSIDADPDGIRARVAHAIIGAMAFGAQNENPPPSDDHWLAQFWRMARAERERQPSAPAATVKDCLTTAEVEALITSCEHAGRRLCFEDPQATEILRKAAAMLIRLSGAGKDGA